MLAKEDPDYLYALGRHFVALACRVHSPRQIGQGRYFAASGFVVSIRNVWFLITAGHIFSEIEQHQREGYRFTDWQLDDTFALRQKRLIAVDGPGAPETIPFNFESTLKASYFDETEGTDYAFIYLSPYYESLLRAGGVLPFEEEHWNLDLQRPADRVELVGTPSDQITQLATPGLVRKTLVTLAVHAGGEDLELTSRFPHLLQAHVPDISESGLAGFEHLRGMSGGPIIGFWDQEDGSQTLRILALQSRWFPSTHTILAYPVEKVILHLQNLLEAVHQWARKKETCDEETHEHH